MTRCATLAAIGLAIAGAGAWASGGLADPIPRNDSPTVYRTVTERVQSAYRGRTAAQWAAAAAKNRRLAAQERRNSVKRGRTIRRLHREARVRWAPTLAGAVRLARAVTGVSSGALLSVAYCESTLNPFAVNGRYRGYWQLGWDPFGLSPFDPYAAALSTAMTVRHDGGWRQWQCKPK